MSKSSAILGTRASARHIIIHRGRLARFFYPPGMQSRNFLSYYATQFKTVEIDSTYYGTPSASTVMNWYERTPSDLPREVKSKPRVGLVGPK